MKKDIENLLSWMHRPDRKLRVSNTYHPFKGSSLGMMSIEEIHEAKNYLDSFLWKGLVTKNGNAWLVNQGRVTILNGYDLIYEEEGQVVDGPSTKDLNLFNRFSVVALTDKDGEILLFAPQVKHRWQVWWFKFIFRRHIKRNIKNLPLWVNCYRETLSLADFLWRANLHKSRF